MTLTRESLIGSVHSQVALSKSRSADLVKALLEIIKRTLESGEDVLIGGFGKFWLKDKEARKGRKPETGEDLILRARRLLKEEYLARVKSPIFLDFSSSLSFHKLSPIRSNHQPLLKRFCLVVS